MKNKKEKLRRILAFLMTVIMLLPTNLYAKTGSETSGNSSWGLGNFQEDGSGEASSIESDSFSEDSFPGEASSWESDRSTEDSFPCEESSGESDRSTEDSSAKEESSEEDSSREESGTDSNMQDTSGNASQAVVQKYTRARIDVQWKDWNNLAGLRPQSGWLLLYADGQEVPSEWEEQQASESSIYTSGELPVYQGDSGEQIVYEISFKLPQPYGTQTGQESERYRLTLNEQAVLSTEPFAWKLNTYSVSGTVLWSGEKQPSETELTQAFSVYRDEEAYLSWTIEWTQDTKNQDLWRYCLNGLPAVNEFGEAQSYFLDLTFQENRTEPARILVAGDTSSADFTVRPELFTMNQRQEESYTIANQYVGTGFGREHAYTYSYTGNTAQADTGSFTLAAGETKVLLFDQGGVLTVEEIPDAEEVLFGEASRKLIAGETETFVHTPARAAIATKNWNDNNNQDGSRPAGIVLSLFYSADGGGSWQSDWNALGIPEPAQPLPDQTSLNDWKYTYENLPQYDQQGNELQYRVEETPVAGYFSQTDPDHPLDIYNTRLETMEFEIDWKDGGNTKGLRPESPDLQLYRGMEGDPDVTLVSLQSADPEAPYYLEVEKNGDSWKISVRNLPSYDPDGLPYVYKVQQNPPETHTEGIFYQTQYKNEGNYTHETDWVYSKGKILNTLTGEMNFTGTKVWKDDPDKAQEERPTATLSLYRFAQRDGQNYTNASPVPEAPNPIVLDPQTDTQMTRDIVFNHLPRFDEDGYEYIYLVKETLSGGKEYAKEVTNTPEYQPVEGSDRYLMDHGVLQNRRSGTVHIQMSKTWYTAARQSELELVSVTLSVQRRAEGGGWEDVEDVSLTGFKAEVLTKSISGSYPEFNEEGKVYEYRVIEKSVETPHSGTVAVINAENTADGGYFEVAPETENGNTYRYEVSYNEQKDNSGKLSAVGVENRLVGEVNLHLIKTWNQPAPVPSDPVSVMIYQNGNFLRTVEITGSPDQTEWKLTVENLPKYDANGAEYLYTVTEKPVPTGDGKFYITDYHYTKQDQKNETVEIVNTPPGEGYAYEVEKVWKDGSDLAHRLPVTIGLFWSTDADQNGVTAQKDQLVVQTVLNSENNWRARVGVPKEIYEAYSVLNPDGTRTFDPDLLYMKEIRVGEYEVDSDGKQVSTGDHLYEVQTEHTGSHYTITNIRKGLVNFEIEKNWIDGDASDTDRPDITYHLKRTVYGSGKEPETVLSAKRTWQSAPVTVSGNSSVWNYRFENLPKYDSEGVIYLYSVSEEISGNTDYAQNIKEESYTVGPLHTGDTAVYKATNQKQKTIVDFTVWKVWMDGTTTLRRPDVYLTLYRDYKKNIIDENGLTIGTEEIREEAVEPYVDRDWTTVHSNWCWSCTFDDLPQYTDEGYEITYYAEETMPGASGWQTQYYQEAPEAPSDINGNAFQEAGKTQTSGGKDGRGVAYDGGTIVNKRREERYLNGIKVWMNIPSSIAKANYPEAVLKLFYIPYENGDQNAALLDESQKKPVRNGSDPFAESGSQIQTVIRNGMTSYQFSGLPKYDNLGRPVYYVVAEEEIPGYTIQVRENQGYFTVTNTYDTSQTIRFTLEKEFSGVPAQTELSGYPVIEVVLKRQMQNLDGNLIAGTLETVQTLRLDPAASDASTYWVKNGDAYRIDCEFTGIQDGKTTALTYFAPNGKPWVYTVQEKSVNGYDQEIRMTEATGVGATAAVKITNTYTGKEPDHAPVQLTLTKKWQDQGYTDTRIEDLTSSLTLYRYHKGKPSPEALGAGDYTLTRNLDTYTYTGLVKYAPNGEAYTYYVVEKTPVGYNTAGKDTQTSKLTMTPDQNEYTLTLSNVYQTATCQTVKKWQYEDGAALTPANSMGLLEGLEVSFKLQRKFKSQAENSWQDYTLTGRELLNGAAVSAGSEVTLTVEELFAAGNRLNITNLPARGMNGLQEEELEYRVRETGISKNGTLLQNGIFKDTVYTGNQIVNTAATRYLFVQKIWEDGDNQDGIRPSSVVWTVSADSQTMEIQQSQPQTLTGIDTADQKTHWPVQRIPVPMYDAQKNERVYAVGEKAIQGYTANGPAVSDYTQDHLSGKLYQIQNHHTPQLGQLKLVKTWEVYDYSVDYYQNHQITVKLYRKDASGWQDTLSAAELKSTNGWEDRIVDLPVFENPQYQDVTHIGSSTQIQYKLEELADEVIQANFSVSSEEFTLIAGTQPTEEKMINTLKTVSVCVQKKWEDSQNRYQSRPADTAVVMELQRKIESGDWETVGHKTLTTASGAVQSDTAVWEKLALHDELGKPYTYRVQEISMGPHSVVQDRVYHYQVTYDQEEIDPGAVWNTESQSTKVTVTNTVEESAAYRNLTVWKEWEDQEDQDGLRSSVKIELYRDGLLVDTKTIQKGQSSVSFTGLPRFQNGSEEESVYTIRETMEENGDYYTLIQVSGGSAPDESGAVRVTAGTVRLTNAHTPAAMKITAAKEWEDQNDRWGLRPEHITLTLYRSLDADHSHPEKVDAQRIISEANWEEEVSWSGLPQYKKGQKYHYWIEEAAVSGYSTRISTLDIEGNGVTADGMEYTAPVCKLTNRLMTCELSVVKQWDGEGLWISERPASVRVQLYQNGINLGKHFQAVLSASEVPGEDWACQFSDLPEKDGEGKAYQYSVRELSEDGTRAVESGQYAFGYQVSYSGDSSQQIITNTLAETDLTVLKKWEDQNNRYQIRDEVRAVQIRLQRLEEGHWTDVLRNGLPWTLEIETENGRVVFEHLKKYDATGKLYQYRAVEECLILRDGRKIEAASEEDGLSKTVGGYSITTELAPAEMDRPGSVTITNSLLLTKAEAKKVWEDQGNQDGKRPTQIEFTLTYDGIADSKLILDGVADQKDSVQSTEGYEQCRADGTRIVYSVTEEPAGEYEAPVITSSDGRNITVTNCYTPQTVDFTVTKVWQGEGDWAADARPDSIQVQLYKQTGASTEKVGEPQTLDASCADAGGNWTYTWTGLPKYENKTGTAWEAGMSEEIRYRVQEVPTAEGYESSVQDSQIINTMKTLSYRVSKQWEDQNNRYHTRPDQIRIVLERKAGEGKWETLPELTLSLTGSTWNEVQFDGLPTHDRENQPYSYRALEIQIGDSPVKENQGGGYTVSYTCETGRTLIQNTLQTISVKGTKVWEDQSDRFGIRPSEVKLAVFLDEDPLEPQPEIVWSRDGDQWVYQIEGLPKYNEAFEEAVYTVMEEETPGYDQTADHPVKDRDGNLVQNFTNTLKTVPFPVQKIWEDQEDAWGLRPDEVTIRLLRQVDGGEIERVWELPDMVLSAGTHWNYTYSLLPQTDSQGRIYTYRIQEVLPQGTQSPYETTVDGGIITNRLKDTRLYVEKVWDDQPESRNVKELIFALQVWDQTQWVPACRAGQEVTAVMEVGQENEKSLSFTNLPQFAPDGTPYQYRAVETAMILKDGTRLERGDTVKLGQYVVTESTEQNLDGTDCTHITNRLSVGSLILQKDRINGQDTEFEFLIMLEKGGKEEPYSGSYILTHADGTMEEVQAKEGRVKLRGGEFLTISDLDEGICYQILEEKTDDFRQIQSENAQGIILRGEIALAHFVNQAVTELQIDNITPNPADSSITNAGGYVVIAGKPHDPDLDPYQEDQLWVCWRPETNWTFGEEFSVLWKETSEGPIEKVTVSHYRNEDGSVKPISDPVYAGLLKRFPDAAIQMEGGEIQLVLAPEAAQMPRQTSVEVQFVPTLAVENTTPENQGGMVQTEDGAPSGISDGVVEVDGHSRYVKRSVTGSVQSGWEVDLANLTVGLPGTLAGDTGANPEAVLLNPDANGRFLVEIYENIAGVETPVTVSGRIMVEYDSQNRPVRVSILLDGLPVPLDLGIAFIKQAPDVPDGNVTPDGVDTGDPLQPWLWAAILAASAFAGFCLIKKRRKE